MDDEANISTGIINANIKINLTYIKRPGTSGISGQLYETTLISLLYFRLLHDDNVEDFYLATNMDEIGAFDDICIKIHVKGHKKPIVLFIQLKHKDKDEQFLDDKEEIAKWSLSVLKIKDTFGSKKCDPIFNSKYTDVECVFILYTNAKYGTDGNIEFNTHIAEIMNRLLTTKDTTGCKPLYTEKDIENLCEKIFKIEIRNIVENFAKFLTNKMNKSMYIMNDEYIKQYHVILAKKVVKVSDIQFDKKNPHLKWRQLTFRTEFFSTTDKHLVFFKTLLFSKLEKDNSSRKEETISEEELSRTLQQMQLEANDMSLNSTDEAFETNAKKKLLSIKLKVPVNFGNVDLVISKTNEKKIENRLNYLRDVIVSLCNTARRFESYKIITIDDTLDEGLLSTNGGLGGLLGNVLDLDESTQLLKFTDLKNCTALQTNARTFYLKVKNQVDAIQDFRFVVTTLKFPRLSFDYTNVSKYFFTNLVVYSKQSNHYEIEDILKKVIGVDKNVTAHNELHNDALFSYYHKQIQEWWMSKNGTYLTKENNIYQQSVNNILIEPQMSGLQNMFHFNKLRNKLYNFTETALPSLHFLNNTVRSIIVTDITALTAVKVIQYLRNKNHYKYVVLDVEDLENMVHSDLSALCVEVKRTEKVVIIVCDKIQNITLCTFNELSNATAEKYIIVITHDKGVEVIQNYFPCPKGNINYENQTRLLDLTTESQKIVIDNAQAIFQGQKLDLKSIVDQVSMKFITGRVLEKILRNENLVIGDALTNSRYEDIKHLYVERRVTETSDNTNINPEFSVKSLYDISDYAVLVTAKPGMGKSTLLTHLSLKTKEIDDTLWIVRIDLIDHPKQFYIWEKKEFDIMSSLKFIFQITKQNYNLQITLKENNNFIHLEHGTADECLNFEINLFLHYYNQRKIIFLFDGFDEICPDYKNTVIKFLNIVKNHPLGNKIWVTSRPYSEILPELKKVFAKSYELRYLNDWEQAVYLLKLWKSKLQFNKLNVNQLNKAISFIKFIEDSETMTEELYLMTIKQNFVDQQNLYKHCKQLVIGSKHPIEHSFERLYFLFAAYLQSHYPHIETTSNVVLYTRLNQAYSRLNSVNSEDDCQEAHTSINTDSYMVLGTPLLLNISGEYLINLICDYETTIDWSFNIYSIYSMFIETKLKKIVFQDKDKMDIYNPNVIKRYKKELNECLDLHKKIAAHILLRSALNDVNIDEFKQKESFDETLQEYKDVISSITSAEEKTGLIVQVNADNVPVFIHRTFTEYFAARYLCDIFLDDKFKLLNKMFLYMTIYAYHPHNIMFWIHNRSKTDEKLMEMITCLQKLEKESGYKVKM